MGYTHYWENAETINTENWRAIATEAHNLIKASGLKLQVEYDDKGKPDINEAFIQFNGADDDGHETFYLTREPTSFEFCKTARKPYDTVVGRLLKFCADTVPGFIWKCDDMKGSYQGDDTVWYSDPEDYYTPLG